MVVEAQSVCVNVCVCLQRSVTTLDQKIEKIRKKRKSEVSFRKISNLKKVPMSSGLNCDLLIAGEIH